jgi:glucose/arabinose dehydrogenase
MWDGRDFRSVNRTPSDGDGQAWRVAWRAMKSLMSTLRALACLSVLPLAPRSPAQEITTRDMSPQRHYLTADRLPSPNEKESVTNRPKTAKTPASPVLNAPAGFRVNVFANEVPSARWLALTPSGDVLVTQKRGNDITWLRDKNGDGVADERKHFGGEKNGLNLPFGIAFHDDAVFIANTDAVLRFPFRRGQEALEGKGVKIYSLPGGGYNQHWTRNVIISPDRQRLFVTVGSESNVDVEPAPRASVLVMNLDGSEARVFASGTRNPIGLAFHPQSKELHVVVNERDRLGDNLVPDYFTRLQDGGFYGWPFAYLRPDLLDPRHVKGGRSTNPELAARTLTPDILLEAHCAAIGLTFYTGNVFPERYRRGAYIALHGSWNRSEASGYKIVFVPFNSQHRPEGYYEDFVTGFVLDAREPTVWGRPTGIMELSDGSLLFSDDENNRVFRVAHAAAR